MTAAIQQCLSTRQVTFSGIQQKPQNAIRFGQTPPPSNSASTPNIIGSVLRPLVSAAKNGLNEVKNNLGRTCLWTAGMFVLGFVPFLHLFLIPAVATFPLLATIDFLKGAFDSLASEPSLKTGLQTLTKTAKSTWESASKANDTPPAKS
jgi:hypothetical protein